MMCWNGIGTEVTLALMRYLNTPGSRTGTQVLRAAEALMGSCNSPSTLYIENFNLGEPFIKRVAQMGGNGHIKTGWVMA